MNHAHINARDEVIRMALAAVTSQLTPMGNSGWRCTLLNGAPRFATAKADGDWLLLEADCSGAELSPGFFWDALVRNASFSGPTKFVLAGDGCPRLRAELLVLDDVDVAARVREACSGFEAAWSPTDNFTAPDVPSADYAAPIDLKRLCAEAGWPFAERGGGKLAVELEVAGGFCQALLIPMGRGVRISCDVATLDDIPEKCRQAVGELLLAASGLVRMSRVSVSTGETPPVARFEVVLGTAPSSSEISSALECLSVACSVCGEETNLLQDLAVAERYLALRGWSANPAAERDERTLTT